MNIALAGHYQQEPLQNLASALPCIASNRYQLRPSTPSPPLHRSRGKSACPGGLGAIPVRIKSFHCSAVQLISLEGEAFPCCEPSPPQYKCPCCPDHFDFCLQPLEPLPLLRWVCLAYTRCLPGSLTNLDGVWQGRLSTPHLSLPFCQRSS